MNKLCKSEELKLKMTPNFLLVLLTFNFSFINATNNGDYHPLFKT